MDYTDVIFQNDMDGAGFLDDAKVKAQELASKAKEQAQKMTAELSEKAKVEAKKRAEELKAESEEMWKNREAIMARLSENAKVAYLEAEKNAKEKLALAKQEYEQLVEKMVPEVNKIVEDILKSSNEYKDLAEDKLEEVRAKLTKENLNKIRAEAEQKFRSIASNAVNEVNKKLNEVIQGGDYYSKYLKYKTKYLELKKEVNQ